MNETTKNYTISDIEKLTEAEAATMATDTAIIKEHNVYFIDFPRYFKNSAIIYKNGNQIKYANEYELHYNHMNYTPEELKKVFYNKINNKLFTEDEIKEPIKNYEDYDKKRYFLQNYYALRFYYISAFYIGNDEKKRIEAETAEKKLHYNPVSFCYMESKEEIKKHIELLNILTTRKEEMKNNSDYWKQAFLHEMFNHEYGINWQADFDTLSSFGNINYKGNTETETGELESYFKQLNFTEEQKKAYFEARREYYKKAEF